MIERAQFTELFGLGEPAIAPSFAEIASFVQGSGCEAHIITNGKDLATNIHLRKLQKIGVSIDGDNAETFETIRTGISFSKVLESIRIFRAGNPSIFLYLVATINRANVDEIPGIARLAKDLRLDAVCFHRMATRQTALSDAMLRNQDIPFYKEQIKIAGDLLSGSSVRLFDYAMLDTLRDEDFPRDKARALAAFRTFTPAQEPKAPSLEDTINMLASLPLPIPPVILQRSWAEQAAQRLLNLFRSALAIFRGSESVTGFEGRTSDPKALYERHQALIERLKNTPPQNLSMPYCLSPWYRFILKADGRMFPCSCWGHTYANINKITSFHSTWNGAFLSNLRASFLGKKELPEKCKSCVTIDRYQGLTELLTFLKNQGLRHEDITKHPAFNPPAGKLKL